MISEQPQEGAPRRPVKEFEDNHYHDDDEVAEAPVEEVARQPAPAAGPARPSRRLPPRPRRFDDD